MKGKGEAKKFFKDMTTGFPDAKISLTHAWAFDDLVVSESTWTGTHSGKAFGIPATKKNVTVKNLDITQVKDGKIVKTWSYSNGADFAQQLGLMPQPGAKKAGEKPAGDKAAAGAPADKKPAGTPADAKPATDKKPADKPAEKK
jgi:steroid delta-isomerase-like uncharacterized protein